MVKRTSDLWNVIEDYGATLPLSHWDYFVAVTVLHLYDILNSLLSILFSLTPAVMLNNRLAKLFQ